MIKKFFMSLVMGYLCVSCAGTGTLGSYDKKGKQIVLHSSSDYRTALPDARERSEVQAVISELNEQIKENPRDVKAMLNLANIYLLENRVDEAQKQVQRALRINLKSLAAKKIMAQIYMRLGNYDMATIILNGLGGDKSRDSEVFNMLAMIAIAEKRNSDAMAFFRRGLELDPNNISIRMNLGVLHVEYRQLAQAAVQFERILKTTPENNDAKVHLAIVRASQGNYDEAEDLYETILARKKDNPLALYNLAVLETQRNNFSEADGLLKRYLSSRYARNAGNDEVYALMEEIETRRKAAGRTSTEEIQSIAQEVNEKKGVRPGSVAKQDSIDGPDESVIDDDIKALEQDIE